MEKNTSPRVFLLPDSAVVDHKKLDVIKLKHPRTGSQICCFLAPDKALYELVKVSSKFSSWLIGDSAIEDGGLYILTPLDPLFILLPYFNKLNKFCPLEDIMVDEGSPDLKHLVECFTPCDLKQISESKDVADFTVYRYNESKTLEWLRKKVNQTAQILNNKNVDINDGSKADILISSNENSSDKAAYLLHSCKLVSEYLPVSMTEQLHEVLGIPMEKDLQSSGEITQQHKKAKTEDVSPLEDYSKRVLNKGPKKTAQKLTVSQKRLMKTDKSGMKSISSFFKKN